MRPATAPGYRRPLDTAGRPISMELFVTEILTTTYVNRGIDCWQQKRFGEK
jgi:hypothetical protein